MSEQTTTKTPYLDGMIAKLMTLRDQVLAVDPNVFDGDEDFRPVIPLVHKVVGAVSDEAKGLYVVTIGLVKELRLIKEAHHDRCGTPEGEADHTRMRELEGQIDEFKTYLWDAIKAALPEDVRNNQSLGIREGGQIVIDLDRRRSGSPNLGGIELLDILVALSDGASPLGRRGL